MNKEEIIRMAREATKRDDWWDDDQALERFAALVAAAERNKLAAWMIQFGFATGHGDTIGQLVDALGSEIVDRIEFEIEAEREECAKLCEELNAKDKTYYREESDGIECAAAIRNRGKQ